MSEPLDLISALDRLSGSIGALEAAQARRGPREERLRTLETELDLLQQDRDRLAADLDQALARSERLDSARVEVSARLEKAVATLRGLLARPMQQAPADDVSEPAADAEAETGEGT